MSYQQFSKLLSQQKAASDSIFAPNRYLHFNWKLIGEPVLCAVAFLDGVILIAMAVTEEIWVAYVGYLAYR